MPVTTTKTIISQDPALTLGGNVVPDMPLSDILLLLQGILEAYANDISLEDLDLTKFGIVCDPKDTKGLFAQIFTSILNNEQVISNMVNSTTDYLNRVQKLVETIESFKVKVTADSTSTKYLGEVITGTPGAININAERIAFSGFVPRGARMYISPKRLPDFDAKSKGKVGTDLEGWAIRNGSNGLDNALNQYVKTVDVLTNGGKIAGSNNYNLSINNIASFSLDIAGTISKALGSIVAKIAIRKVGKRFGGGASRDVLIPDDGVGDRIYNSDPIDVSHTHAHTLSVKHDNQKPTPLAIDLSHIKEIPIEYIGS